MDLLTLVTACALTVDPKLMHALVWHHSGGEPWAIERLFFPHCKMEPAWGADFAFAVDVSATYGQKRAALAEYGSIFNVAGGDRLLTLYEAEDAYVGRMFSVPYAEAFRSHSPLLVASPAQFLPGLHG